MFKTLKKVRHLVRRTAAKGREVIKHGRRSSKWPALERQVVAERRECAACGSTKHLQVHHIKPFHLHPELELDPANLIVLCMDEPECHLLIGHGDSFRAFNPDVVVDAARSRSHPEERPAIWDEAKFHRLF